MKSIVFIILTSLCINLHSQNTDSLGLDNNPVLTELEIDYFNNQFKGHYSKMDFSGAKIGFLFGNGYKVQTKKEYFDTIKKRLSHGYTASVDELIKLKEIDKERTGGYDAIIISWSKLIVGYPHEEMLEKFIK